MISTVVGDGSPGSAGDSGPAISAQFNGAWGLAVDASGNILLAAANNNRIRRVGAR